MPGRVRCRGWCRPWQPLTVIAEADSLADGRAVLGLPAGLRWVARHDPSGFVAGRRFVDELRIGGWRHTHEFSYAAPGKTRVTGTANWPTTWPRTAGRPRPGPVH